MKRGCYRGHCAELSSYWHHLGVDKSKIAQAYIAAIKQKIYGGECKNYLIVNVLVLAFVQ